MGESPSKHAQGQGKGKKEPRKYIRRVQFFLFKRNEVINMGGRGSSSSSGKSLTPIEVDKDWLYKPRDDSQIFANPVQYVGNDLAREIVGNVYSFDYEAVEEKTESVSLASLKSVQAFVTENGINSTHRETEGVYAVKFGNDIYLMDGNHRVAKAKLDGKKTYRMKVTSYKKVRG